MKKQVFFAFITLFLSIMTTAQDYYLYTGSYTKGSKDGIYIFKITVPSGQTTLIDIVKDIENPSYLAVSKDGRFMYAVSEMASDHKGMIYAFQLDPKPEKPNC